MSSWLAAAVVAATPLAAAAHPAASHGGGLASGFAHPLSGWDHQLAMIAIGLWAVQQRGAARAATPIGFVGGAACGLIAGGVLVGAVVPALLAVSTIAAGLAAALSLRPGAALALLAALGLGVVHGHAHAGDLAASALPARFAAGFLLATVALHALGFGFALVVPSHFRRVAAATGGAVIAASGLVLLVALG